MKKYTSQSGFTLVEMLVAVMILTLAVTALLSVSAGASGSARYAKNKITANWLAQQSLDYVRNTRDTALVENSETVPSWWGDWVAGTLGTPGNKCFAATGCYTDIGIQGSSEEGLPSAVLACGGSGCPAIRSNAATLQYDYAPTSTPAPFKVTIRAYNQFGANIDLITVTATVSWVEPGGAKSISQSILLTKWGL